MDINTHERLKDALQRRMYIEIDGVRYGLSGKEINRVIALVDSVIRGFVAPIDTTDRVIQHRR